MVLKSTPTALCTWTPVSNLVSVRPYRIIHSVHQADTDHRHIGAWRLIKSLVLGTCDDNSGDRGCLNDGTSWG